MKSKVKQTEYGFKMTDNEFNHTKPLSPFTDYESMRAKNNQTLHFKQRQSLETRDAEHRGNFSKSP